MIYGAGGRLFARRDTRSPSIFSSISLRRAWGIAWNRTSAIGSLNSRSALAFRSLMLMLLSTTKHFNWRYSSSRASSRRALDSSIHHILGPPAVKWSAHRHHNGYQLPDLCFRFVLFQDTNDLHRIETLSYSISSFTVNLTQRTFTVKITIFRRKVIGPAIKVWEKRSGIQTKAVGADVRTDDWCAMYEAGESP